MKSVLLIGLGRFGKHIARELHALGHEVMAIDECEERIDEILPYVTSGQIGDSTNEAFLASLDVPSFDVCFVTVSNDFQASLETTSLLKELGAKLVISRAERDGQAKFLLRNGADEVLYPERDLAKWAAIRFTSNHIMDYIELDDDHGIFEVDVPDQWEGKSILQIDIRKKYGINILGVKRQGQLSLTVDPNRIFNSEDSILVLGTYKDLKKCFHI